MSVLFSFPHDRSIVGDIKSNAKHYTNMKQIHTFHFVYELILLCLGGRRVRNYTLLDKDKLDISNNLHKDTYKSVIPILWGRFHLFAELRGELRAKTLKEAQANIEKLDRYLHSFENL